MYRKKNELVLIAASEGIHRSCNEQKVGAMKVSTSGASEFAKLYTCKYLPSTLNVQTML